MGATDEIHGLRREVIVPPQRDVSWLGARDVPLRGWRARYGEVASVTSGGGSAVVCDPDPRPADAGAADLRLSHAGVADAGAERAGARIWHDLHEDGEIGVPDLDLLLTRQTHDVPFVSCAYLKDTR